MNLHCTSDMDQQLAANILGVEEDNGRVESKSRFLNKISIIRRYWGLSMRVCISVFFCSLIASLFILNIIITSQFRVAHFIDDIKNDVEEEDQQGIQIAIKKTPGYVVYKEGCRIVDLKPVDKFSKPFMRVEEPIKCEFGSKMPLVESNDTSLFINLNAVNQYYDSLETVECCWRSFKREEKSDNIVKFSEHCQKFKDSINAATEYVKIECFEGEKQIYTDYFFFVPRKEEVERRCQLLEKNTTVDNQRRKLSLLIVGLDAVSRLNFHRMMPKTVKALKNIGAVEMLGYTKVGDNTYPNLVPVLSGLSEDELQIHCWNDTRKPFDDCPWLWKNFSASGFRTIFAEDACIITTFNYLKPGFQIQPTDYYYRPYCVAAENDIGNTHKSNANLCIGTRLSYQNLLNYTKLVAKEFANDPFFGFFWESSLTHDFFSYPQLGDDSYEETIASLQRDGLLNNTALIVMSDHGIRWGNFRETAQGRMEVSLPFVFMVLPEWWKKEYSIGWENLQRNSNSLTSPFDLHETILDILDPESITEEFIRKRTESTNQDVPRGISWFLPIPDYRTCDMAGISESWCKCHISNNISITDPIVKITSNYLIEKLNEIVKQYPQCEKLELKDILKAKMWTQSDEGNGTPLWIDYTVMIETLPGNAIFEGSIKHTTDEDTYTLVGSIERLNLYGNQSACVEESHMRLYCYCHQ